MTGSPLDKSLIQHIKHFTRVEFRSGRNRFLKTMLSSSVCGAYLLIGDEFIEETMLLPIVIGVGVPIFFFLHSYLLPTAYNQIQQNSQSVSFSWKYFHSVVFDRPKFIIAFCISSLFNLFPAFVFLALLVFSSLDYRTSLVFWLVPIVIGCLILKLMSLNQVIKINRVMRFKYNDSFSSKLFRLFRGISIFVYLWILLLGTFMVVLYTQAYSNIYGSLTLSCILLLSLVFKYQDLLRSWSDETYSGWVFKRDIPLSFIFTGMTIFFFIVNVEHHGLMGGTHVGFVLIEKGDLKNLSSLLEEDDYSKIKNREGSNFLHHAILNNRPKVINLLLKNGFKLDQKVTGRVSDGFEHRLGKTSLFLAIETGADDALKLILDLGVDPDLTVEGLPAISYAAQECEPHAIELLINAGANVNIISDKKVNPLFYGVKGECLIGIKQLIKKGANIEFRSPSGSTYKTYAKKSHPKFYKSLEYQF